MAMSYTTLVGDKSVTGSIRSWQNYDKVDAEGVLEDAQGMIYQTLRVREMLDSRSVPVAVAASTATLPTGYLDPVKFRNITSDYTLKHKHEADLEELRSYTNGVLNTGDAHHLSVYGGAIQFEVRATLEWTGRLTYYRSLTALGSNNETNFLTTRYPHILRAMCLAMAAEFSHNTEDYARNLQRATSLINEANAMDELSRRGQDVQVEGP